MRPGRPIAARVPRSEASASPEFARIEQLIFVDAANGARPGKNEQYENSNRFITVVKKGILSIPEKIKQQVWHYELTVTNTFGNTLQLIIRG